MFAMVLSAFSRNPDSVAYTEAGKPPEGKELRVLKREYPDFESFVRGKKVLDFGCGKGLQTVALARDYDCQVTGSDTNPACLNAAAEAVQRAGVSDKVTLIESSERIFGEFDTVISLNAMEHFPDPLAMLLIMKRNVPRGGNILITFGPPWYAPYGAHMMHFTKLPWVNLLFPERVVMAVRARYNNDGAKRYEDCEGGLNKMSVRKFNRIIRESGLTIQRINYRCVAGQNWLARIPILRELFINHITCVLTDSPRRSEPQ